MTIRTRLCAALLVLVGLGFYALVNWILDDLRPRYLETMEESMVDTATLLSSYVANALEQGEIPKAELHAAFHTAHRRIFSAKIYELTKTTLNMRVYITDKNGIVQFDSDRGRDEGKDYSEWNDVYLTLHGQYGARTSHKKPDDPATAILYVASPIEVNGEIVGSLTVCKPADSVNQFVINAQNKITLAGIVATIAVVLLGIAISFWLTRPITMLTDYATRVRDGKRAKPPVLSGELKTLGIAFEEMREALEGKQYVENYVQSLTHQMKSPLSAIRGAAELLEEEMPAEQRAQFLSNLRAESGRIQGLVDRMLELSALENRTTLQDVAEFDVSRLLAEVVASQSPVLSQKQLTVNTDVPEAVFISGERFLIRQAVSNLIQNAIEFTEQGGTITIALVTSEQDITLTIEDNGSGIPDYALGQVFERFYSLPRPATGRKSSGLGLAFVREVAELHGGHINIENSPDAGARAVLTLPITSPSR